MKRQTGFTIMELMIVLSIAGIMAAIGGPMMKDFIKNNRLQSKTHAVMADLLYARGEAVKRKQRIVMCPSPNSSLVTPACGGTSDYGAGGYIVFNDLDSDDTFDSATEEIMRRGPAALNNVTVRSNNGLIENQLVYLSDGSIGEDGDTAQFAICDDRPEAQGFGRRIDVRPHGRPAIVTGITDCTP